jgi:hypothetical protein
MKWRQSTSGPLPIRGERRGGRGRQTVFDLGAPLVAAELAIALSQHRNLTIAVLTAFGEGAPVAPDGVQHAYEQYLDVQRARVKEAVAASHLPQSDIPRRLRLTAPGRRNTPDTPSTDVLSLISGEPQGAGTDSIELAVDYLLDAVAPNLNPNGDDRARLQEAIKTLNLRALRRSLYAPDVEVLVAHLARAVSDVRTLQRHHETMSELLDLTNTKATALPEPINTLLALPLTGSRSTEPAPTRGASVALRALFLHSQTNSDEDRRNKSETIQALAAGILRTEAMLSLVRSLPPKWRPALGPMPGRSQLFLASLTTEEQAELSTAVRAWSRAHPEEDRLLRDDADEQEGAETAT